MSQAPYILPLAYVTNTALVYVPARLKLAAGLIVIVSVVPASTMLVTVDPVTTLPDVLESSKDAPNCTSDASAAVTLNDVKLPEGVPNKGFDIV